jgi:nucleotide-binding universal stress UspA family protein
MNRILVALDASPRAPQVLAVAAQLAEASKAKLVLLRAVGIPPDLPRELLLNVSDANLEEFLIGNARRQLQELAKAIPAERVEQIEATFGTAWDAICTTAREKSADLIVIGSHGYGRLDRVLGTTAAKVVNHADRNVLVVRTPL